MAITETIRDLENYPSKTRTVTLDLLKVVPIDNQGDEVYVLTASAGSSSVRLGGGTINQLFVREFKAGYARSSGFKNPPFNITSSNNTIQISIDGSAFHAITLANGYGLSGEDIAADLQAKINALAGTDAPEEGKIEFLNCSVEFKNSKLLIVSGSISNTYTGVGRSSVSVLPGATNDASVSLGFDIYVTSEGLASKTATETILTTAYSGGTTLSVEGTTSYSAGEAFMITDGTQKEYFVAADIDAGEISISGSGLALTYSGGSVVQRIFERDPDAQVASPYATLDEITRFALRAIANQTDFSA